MPQAKRITHYPWEAYLQVFRQVAHTRKPLRLASRAGMKGSSLQGILYAFRRACERDEAEALALGINVRDIQACSMRVEKETGDLIIEHREETEAVLSIRAAMAEQGFRPEPRKTAADESLAKLDRALRGSPDPYKLREEGDD